MALNQSLGNMGSTVRHIQTAPAEAQSFPDLVNAMRAGRVKALMIMGVNPVYTAPVDYEFSKHLSAVPFRIHLGSIGMKLDRSVSGTSLRRITSNRGAMQPRTTVPLASYSLSSRHFTAEGLPMRCWVL